VTTSPERKWCNLELSGFSGKTHASCYLNESHHVTSNSASRRYGGNSKCSRRRNKTLHIYKITKVIRSEDLPTKRSFFCCELFKAPQVTLALFSGHHSVSVTHVRHKITETPGAYVICSTVGRDPLRECGALAVHLRYNCISAKFRISQ
jgi:hypothetical protein